MNSVICDGTTGAVEAGQMVSVYRDQSRPVQSVFHINFDFFYICVE